MGVCRPVHCILTLFMILEQDITLPRPFLDLPSKRFTRVRTLYLGRVRSQLTVLAFCYCRLVLFDIAYTSAIFYIERCHLFEAINTVSRLSWRSHGSLWRPWAISAHNDSLKASVNRSRLSQYRSVLCSIDFTIIGSEELVICHTRVSLEVLRYIKVSLYWYI